MNKGISSQQRAATEAICSNHILVRKASPQQELGENSRLCQQPLHTPSRCIKAEPKPAVLLRRALHESFP